jgi:hypothetical protein
VSFVFGPVTEVFAPQPIATLTRKRVDRIEIPSVLWKRLRCHKRPRPSKKAGITKKVALPVPLAGANELDTAGMPIVNVVDWAVLVAFPVMVAGLKEHVEPVGKPVHLKVTTPVKPSDEKTESVTGMFWPAFMDSIVGLTDIEKSRPPLTLSSNAVDVLARLLTSPE